MVNWRQVQAGVTVILSNFHSSCCSFTNLTGTEVCRRAFARFLGIGCARLQRTRHRFKGMDERTLPGQGPKQLAVLFFPHAQGDSDRCQKGHFNYFWGNVRGQGTRPALATASITSFLRKLYFSISESMPTKFPGCRNVIYLLCSGVKAANYEPPMTSSG